MEQGVLIYTTAPVDYDGFGTTTIGVFGLDRRGREIRGVKAVPRHADWQRQRYGSGLCLVLDEAQMLEAVQAGLYLAYGDRERELLEQASKFDEDLRADLTIILAGSTMIVNHEGTELAPYVDANGQLNEDGRDLAALITMRDQGSPAEFKRAAFLRLVERARSRP
jgi:hypothetical protein